MRIRSIAPLGITILAAVLAGCGSTASSSGATTAACTVTNTSAMDGGGASVSIGAKDFAEEKLLATITKIELSKHNFNVTFNTVAADPGIDQALTQNKIQMLWQYTGTELQSFLNVDTPPRDLTAAFNLAQQKDAARGLCWTSPSPLDDTNGIAIKSSDVAKFGSTLTDFSTYIKAHNDVHICIMSEFRTRADGLPGLDTTYGGWANYPGLTDVQGTAEKNIASGQCQAGEVFTTDSAIAADNLHVLTDDKKFFPPDNVGLIVRQEVLSAHPAIANIMAPVAAKLTSDEITQLNKQVEIDGESVDSVATAWLQQNGF